MCPPIRFEWHLLFAGIIFSLCVCMCVVLPFFLFMPQWHIQSRNWRMERGKKKSVERQIKWISISESKKRQGGAHIFIYAQYVECKVFHTCSNRFDEIDPAGSHNLCMSAHVLYNRRFQFKQSFQKVIKRNASAQFCVAKLFNVEIKRGALFVLVSMATRLLRRKKKKQNKIGTSDTVNYSEAPLVISDRNC